MAKCYECNGKGYFKTCPIEMAEDSPEGHEDCPVCGGNYYDEYICVSCNGTGED